MALGRLLPHGPLGVRLVWSASALLAVAYVAALLAGVAASGPVQSLPLPAVLAASTAVCLWRSIAVPADRLAWLLLTAGLAAWLGAELVNALWISRMDPVPLASAADVLWLAEYPLVVAALALLLRRRSGRVPFAFWLEATFGAVTVAAVALIAIARLLPEGDASTLELAVNAAYPAGDLLLCVALAGAYTLGSFALRGRWLLLAVSFLAQVISDWLYLGGVAADAYASGTVADLGWYVAPVALAAAAWRDERSERPVVSRWRSPAVAAICGITALALLSLDHFQRLPTATVVLATLAIALVLARLALVFRENHRLLRRAHEEARTDALTGLGNRRALLDDLDHAVGSPGVLAMYDLDGFKAYNDAFGHPAGDELLRRLGARLGEVAAASGARAYRLGGDEFCLLATVDPASSELVAARGRRALGESGDGFQVGASAGSVELPVAGGAAAALAEADGRMYAVKHGGRPSAARQTAGALLAAVAERHPDLGDHVGQVAQLAVAVARHMDLCDRELESVREAAELHDVGKIAIPDAILNKPGPLDEAELRFMRRHTIIGERIMLAAPSLKASAPLVRSSHERWDGGGYPDGLAGERIPLGSRIVAVCDAFDAIVADRPYRAARSPEEAIAELRRCSGTQFDPAVVDAFAAVFGRLRAAA